MLFEDILLLLLIGSAVFFFGIPFYKLMMKLLPQKKNSLVEAKQRLEQAHIDAEAARLNKEAEKIYSNLYQDVLDETDVEEDEQTTKHRRV